MLHGSPQVYTYSDYHQIITQSRTKGPQGSYQVRNCNYSSNPCLPKNG